MNDLNFHHCVSPMMAINIVAFGILMSISVTLHASKALTWLYEPYDHNNIRWRNFRKRVAKALNEDREKILAVNWIQTYKERFPDEWKEIEDVAEQLRSKPSDSSNA